jgi:hypothetical protein
MNFLPVFLRFPQDDGASFFISRLYGRNYYANHQFMAKIAEFGWKQGLKQE